MLLHVGQIDDAVVHQRTGLIRQAFVHRPDPGEPQVVYVFPRNLRQCAVIPRLIIPADHEPVGGIGMNQHLIGDRNVFLHLTCHSNPGGRASWPGRRRQLKRRGKRGSRCWQPAPGDRAHQHRICGSQWLVSRRSSIHPKKINAAISSDYSSPSEPGLLSGIVLRIRSKRSLVGRLRQVFTKLIPASGDASPLLPEVGHVATGALFSIDGASGSRLLGGVGPAVVGCCGFPELCIETTKIPAAAIHTTPEIE